MSEHVYQCCKAYLDFNRSTMKRARDNKIKVFVYLQVFFRNLRYKMKILTKGYIF